RRMKLHWPPHTSPSLLFFLASSGPPRALPSFPTRRSSDLNAVTFLVSAVLLLRIPGRALEAPIGPRRGHWRELAEGFRVVRRSRDRKSTRLNSSHRTISYAVFCLKKKNLNRIGVVIHICDI